jgi:Tol biopolymer transport system component
LFVVGIGTTAAIPAHAAPSKKPGPGTIAFQTRTGISTVTDTSNAPVRRLQGGGSSPSWSPDGSKIAYSNRDGIYVEDANGMHRKLVVKHGYDPTWSPDGARLAYTRATDLSIDTYVADANGTREKRLTNDGESGWASWSPDGVHIAFEGRVGAPNYYGVRVMNADGTHKKNLYPDAGTPAWSPDSKTIVATSYDSILLFDINGRNVRTIDDGHSTFVRGAVFSPDGTRLAYTSDWNIATIGVDGTGFRVVATVPRHDGYWNPTWRS